MSRPISFSSADTSGVAIRPAASVPARTISSCCCAADNWLVELLNTISERMSDSSSGGTLDMCSEGIFQRPEDADAGLDAGNHARHEDVNIRSQIAVEVDRAVGLQIEAAAHEREGAGDLIERAVHVEVLSGSLGILYRRDRRAPAG